MFRTAVSRAYYAAHWSARERLKFEGSSAPKQGAHEWVINQFKNSKDRTRLAVADDLDKLRNQRVKADYKAEATIQQAAANFATKLADWVIQRLNTL
jgi:uncharacterized protein (UPF0332 family)